MFLNRVFFVKKFNQKVIKNCDDLNLFNSVLEKIVDSGWRLAAFSETIKKY